ncbi:alpha-L-glutamate ligase [Streptomyces sp. NBC_01343]|uniref:ATP-grasp domain-containing protein n=1 Tax=Streptomyces sp. NBC_01343 TaxID=2903832 RepID=UPI002E11D0C2|nr:alpha-L-glutamate ligase [Streptomyces sp. NBC_01343]
MVTRALADRGADVVAVDPRFLARATVELALSGSGGSGLSGVIRTGGRPVEPDFVPGLAPAEHDRARRVHDTLLSFTEVAHAMGGRRIANPLSAMASNMSKPYQAQLIARHGFYTPATLVSDDPDEVLGFVDLHRGAVYKSASGIRSVVTAFDPVRDTGRLERLRWCPVQFQERLDGPDVRVHVVGDRTFAVRVDSTAVDYRYARDQVGVDARLHAHRLDDEVAERCVALACGLGLPFAGVDLKLLPDGRIACFEVNPAPGFSWYESETGLPIAAAVADWLLGPVSCGARSGRPPPRQR